LGAAGLSGLAAGFTTATVMFLCPSACSAAIMRSDVRFNAEFFFDLGGVTGQYMTAWILRRQV
jgi:hypothetical protein